jgi:hypothetical protein
MPLAEIIPVDDLTDRYDLGERGIDRLLRTGRLVGFKLGRRRYVHVDDWNAYVDSLRARATAAAPDLVADDDDLDDA